jgi:hypothetical protein
MRAFVQRSLACAVFGLAAGLSGRVLAQSPQEALVQSPENIEEVIVRGGKTLSQYRLELEQEHDELNELFNELNEGKDNDVRCRDESTTGTRIPQRACRSHAQQRADANGSRDFLNSLYFSSGAGDGGPQVNGAVGAGGALGDAINAGSRALVLFEKEWTRVLGGNPQFYAAVVEYVELKEEFDRMRGVPLRAPTQQPRQIVLGPAGPLCEASTLTEYEQLDNVARVSGTVSISSCPAGTTGMFTLVARVRDEAGAVTPLEFSERWQRADALDHVFSADYPIGDDVFLESVRVRGLTCACEGPTR